MNAHNERMIIVDFEPQNSGPYTILTSNPTGFSYSVDSKVKIHLNDDD